MLVVGAQILQINDKYACSQSANTVVLFVLHYGSQLDNKEQIYLLEKTKFAREQRLRLRIIGSIGEWGYLELTLSLFSAPAHQDRKRW